MPVVWTTRTKSGPGDAIALLHCLVQDDARLERLLLVVALPLQRNFQHGLQPVPEQWSEPVGVQDRDLPLDQPGIAQPLYPAQASRRRDVHAGGQVLVAARGVRLQLIQNIEIRCV